MVKDLSKTPTCKLEFVDKLPVDIEKKCGMI